MARSAAVNCLSVGTTRLCTVGPRRSCSEVSLFSSSRAKSKAKPMCGICGQYNFGDQAPVHRQNIVRMTKSIVHRGPDDEGYYVAGPLGLGFRRLSIIDLEGGHQPM